MDVLDRFVVTWSWQVAAELARRNPNLVVLEHQPVSMYDCLGLWDQDEMGAGPLIDLNRPGSMHVPSRDLYGAAHWEDVAKVGVHEVVRRLEDAAGLRPAAKTTARSLAYRVLAVALAARVADKHVWDARSLHLDGDGNGSSELAPRDRWVDQFGPLRDAMARFPRFGWSGEPASHAFALTRDHEPVLVVDVHGSVYTRSGRILDLWATFQATGRHLHRTVAATVDPVTP